MSEKVLVLATGVLEGVGQDVSFHGSGYQAYGQVVPFPASPFLFSRD
jgi:hypothetical protein